jgi:Protein of unknown function with PCYCGC motif
MKKNWLLFGAIAVLATAALLFVNSACIDQSKSTVKPANPSPAAQAHNHTHLEKAAVRVPAFQIAPTRASLGPTLEPDRFTGLTRDAYRAVKQIPLTIAQLPCYCHCDEGFGHKSLYSCFEDDHAAHCATCVNEALLALSLQRDQKLTPEQIRERIVQQYSNQ